MEILCAMYAQDVFQITGSLEKIARMTRCESSEVAKFSLELKQSNVADVTLCNGDVTLLSRKLKRELSVKEQTRLRVQSHRGNGNVTVQSNKKEVKSKKREEENGATAPVDVGGIKTKIANVFTHWQKVCNKPRHSLTSDRETIIKARLKEFTVDELQQAINIAAADPFYAGRNDRQTEFLDFKTIFKNKGKVENFLFSSPRSAPKQISPEQEKMEAALKRTQDMFYGR